MTDYWASDVRISMPLPLRQQRRVPMSGFVFTDFGMAHDMDEATYKKISTPTYLPDNFGEKIYDDSDLDTNPPTSLAEF